MYECDARHLENDCRDDDDDDNAAVCVYVCVWCLGKKFHLI